MLLTRRAVRPAASLGTLSARPANRCSVRSMRRPRAVTVGIDPLPLLAPVRIDVLQDTLVVCFFVQVVQLASCKPPPLQNEGSNSAPLTRSKRIAGARGSPFVDRAGPEHTLEGGRFKCEPRKKLILHETSVILLMPHDNIIYSYYPCVLHAS